MEGELPAAEKISGSQPALVVGSHEYVRQSLANMIIL